MPRPRIHIVNLVIHKMHVRRRDSRIRGLRSKSSFLNSFLSSNLCAFLSRFLQARHWARAFLCDRLNSCLPARHCASAFSASCQPNWKHESSRQQLQGFRILVRWPNAAYRALSSRKRRRESMQVCRHRQR